MRKSDSGAVGLKLCRQRDRDTGKKQGRNDEQRLEGHAHRDLMVLRAASPDHVETSAARHKVWVCKARLQALQKHEVRLHCRKSHWTWCRELVRCSLPQF